MIFLKIIAAPIYFFIGVFLITCFDSWVMPGIYPQFMTKAYEVTPQLALKAYSHFGNEQKTESDRYDFLAFKNKYAPDLRLTSIGINPKCFPGKVVNSLGDQMPTDPIKNPTMIALHEKFFAQLPCPTPGNPLLYAVGSKQAYNSIWSFAFSIGKDGKLEPVDFPFNPLPKALGVFALLVAGLLAVLNAYAFRNRLGLWFISGPNYILILGLLFSLGTCFAQWHMWVRV